MQSEIESIKRLKNPKYKVSCHYLINRKGKIIQMVRDKHMLGMLVNLNGKNLLILTNIL